MTAKNQIPCPTESQEQQTIFMWAATMEQRHPELSMLYHIPNGGKRHVATAKRLKREGVKAGVPDICLPVPRGKYHGLYIELKRLHGNTTSAPQNEWITSLKSQGYHATVCRGWVEASEEITRYLNIPDYFPPPGTGPLPLRGNGHE